MEDCRDPDRGRIDHLENLLKNAILMAETGADLKEKCTSAEKYLTNLKTLVSQGNRSIVALESISKSCLLGAKNLLNSVPATSLNPKIKEEYERLLSVILNHLHDYEERSDYSHSPCESPPPTHSNGNKLNLLQSGSSKSVNKLEIDEKYPESWSRDSSIDLNYVSNLQSVPEDVFTTFTSSMHKPKRSSSLSSLKSMRKVKLFLQRAENSEDEDTSSDPDDHEFIQKGENSDDNSGSLVSKKVLGNITEESQDF